MGRSRPLVLVVTATLVAVASTGCQQAKSADRTKHRTMPSTTLTVPEPTTPPDDSLTPQTARLGQTLDLQAAQGSYPGDSVPSNLTAVDLGVTLTDVKDPAPPALDSVDPGDHWIELTFGIKDNRSVSFTNQEPRYNPPLTFAVDNAKYGDEPGGQPLPIEGYDPVENYEPAVPGSCPQISTIAPGATATDCLVFQLPIGVPVVLASVALTLGDTGGGSLGEWRIPPPATTAPATPSDGVTGIARLGETLTLNASGQVSQGPEIPKLTMTLDQVIDPAPTPSGPSIQPLVPGDRWVALRFTISNVGNVTIPCYENGEYALGLEWAFDPEANGDGGYSTIGLPSCGHGQYIGLASGVTTTSDVPIQIPNGVPVVRATTEMGYAGVPNNELYEWLIP